jgi:two-component system cell cycle sensor histidine kinase/response regulator CckA
VPALIPLTRPELLAWTMSTAKFREIEKLADLRREEPRVTILLAEDESSLRQMLGLVLQAAGYHLMIAEDGRQAVQLAREHAGRIDLLLSDIEMPGLTGPDLAQELLLTRPNLKVMLMSGCMSALGVFEREWRFLQKPFAPIRLLEEIQIALH